MTLIALIGAKALLLMYIWLLSAITASYLSERKGYGEKLGLAFGLLLTILGPITFHLDSGFAGQTSQTMIAIADRHRPVATPAFSP